MELYFPQEIINAVDFSGMLMLAALFVIGFILIMRYAGNILPGFMGILLYLLIGYVGNQVIVILLIAIPFTRGLMANEIVYCLVNAISFAGLFQLARWLVIKMCDRSNVYELGGYLMAGLGLGIGHAVKIGINLISISSMGMAVNSADVGTLFFDMSEAELAEIVATVERLKNIPINDYILMGINAVIAIAFQVFACVFLYGVMKKGMNKMWHWYVIGMSFVLEMFYALGEYDGFGLFISAGVRQFFVNTFHMDLYLLSTMGMLLVVIVELILAFRVNKEYLNGELTSFDKLKKKTGPMPRMKK